MCYIVRGNQENNGPTAVSDINIHQKVTVIFLYLATWYLCLHDGQKAYQPYCSLSFPGSEAINVQRANYNITDD